MSRKEQHNNVTVGVRIRPMNEKEVLASMPVYFSASQDATEVQELNEEGVMVKHWSYDNVFGPECSNSFIFDAMGKGLVDAAVDGYNAVLFMYGQTSSGKTFTLFGGGDEAGVVMDAMEYLHWRIMSSTDTEFLVRLTYAELYNEELKDLLATTPSSEGLKIVDDPNLGPLIQGITEAAFVSAGQIKTLLQEGESRRRFGVTNMNAHSSRSHVMVRLSIEMRRVASKPLHPLRQSWGKDKPNVVSTLNLVDLAGSERANKSGTSGQALKEGSFINKSLLTLGTVISNLSEGKLAHIPYRNSKLTRLLATALGGNAKTCMITCISPASGNVMESLSTLRFASRAKRIVNVVHKNEIMTVKTLASKLALQSAEMDQLRAKLEQSRQMGFSDQGAGETIKDKAVSVSRNMRILRFLMTNAPKLVRCLRRVGEGTLVKKVQEDLKMAISGHRELGVIADEHTRLMVRFMPGDRKLLMRVQQLQEDNESEKIISDLDPDSDGDSDGLDLGVGAEELQEAVEGAHFAGEDLRAHAFVRITTLEGQLAERSARKRALLVEIEMQRGALVEAGDAIKRHEHAEETLRTHVQKCEEELKKMVQRSYDLNLRTGELEVQLGDRDTELRDRGHELLSREGEVAKLVTNCDLLGEELEAALASRKAFEDDVSRTRNDMRVQMDKMRNTMHHMLLQGGEETKVVESQNGQLQNELDSARDYLELETKGKERLETEISHLRGNIKVLQKEQRTHMAEITICRDENASTSASLQEARSRLARSESAQSVSEELALKVQRQLADAESAREDLVASHRTELRFRVEQIDTQFRDLQVEHHTLQMELAFAREGLEGKTGSLNRMEYVLQTDTARFDKKLSAAVRATEDIAQELTAASGQMQVQAARHEEEVRKLREKTADLQAMLDSVTRHLEDQFDPYDMDIDCMSGSFYVVGRSRATSYASYDGQESPDRDPRDKGVSIAALFPSHPDSHNPDSHNPNLDSPYPDSHYWDDIPLAVGRSGEGSENDDTNDARSVSPLPFSNLSSPGKRVSFKKRLSPSPAPATTAPTAPTPTLCVEAPVRAHTHTQSHKQSAAAWRSQAQPPDTHAQTYNTLTHTQSSAQFTRLKVAMQLLSTALAMGVQDEHLLRTFLVSRFDRGEEEVEAAGGRVQTLSDRVDLLQESGDCLMGSLEHAKEVGRLSGERMALVEGEFEALKVSHQALLRAQNTSQGRVSKYELLHSDQALHVERLRQEKVQHLEIARDVSLQSVHLQARLEESEEARMDLQSQLDLNCQELGVLRAERDELMKRFVRPTSPEPPTPTPTPPTLIPGASPLWI
mmetsp:Transcript_27020/g.61188  ORF Transcript_27020/g.61188 Transcript_27020/m.61188 type:complete len:1318 (+) Transcript_27020:423-4376(+)